MDIHPCDPHPLTGKAEMLLVSLGDEEAMILLQPGQMFRLALDGDAAASLRFLVPLEGAGGLLAAIPRTLAPVWLRRPAGHEVELEFQERIFDLLDPSERPPR